MACLGIRSPGGVATRDLRVMTRVENPGRVPTRVSIPPAMRRWSGPTMVIKCSAAVAAVEATDNRTSVGGPEKFDQWIKESVGEIVKNLPAAPLFVHVYGGPNTRVKTEKAVETEWAHLKGRWVRGEEPSPEGIILVEELKEDELGILEEEKGQNGDCTKAWGVLIQGKGEDGGVACYLLKTSRVGGSNLGLFCTHYCLVKVKNFRESAKSQLTTCWLG